MINIVKCIFNKENYINFLKNKKIKSTIEPYN